MNKILAMSIVLVLVYSCQCTSNSANSSGKDIAKNNKNQRVKLDTLRIIKKIQNIDSSLSKFDSITLDVYGKTIEPEVRELYRHGSSILTGYITETNGLAKIMTVHEGDRVTLESYYYFDNGILLFVKKVKYKYQPPKWEKSSKITNKKICEYYLENNRLVFNSCDLKNKVAVKGSLKSQAKQYEEILKNHY